MTCDFENSTFLDMLNGRNLKAFLTSMQALLCTLHLWFGVLWPRISLKLVEISMIKKRKFLHFSTLCDATKAILK